MLAAVVLIAGLCLLPLAALSFWRLQRGAIGALAPGARFRDVARLADLPVSRTLGAADQPVVAGPIVRLLGVTREAALVLVAYRRVGSGEPAGPSDHVVNTVLLRLHGRRAPEMAVLDSWKATGTPVVVETDLAAGEVVIQHPSTRLTVKLPLVA